MDIACSDVGNRSNESLARLIACLPVDICCFHVYPPIFLTVAIILFASLFMPDS